MCFLMNYFKLKMVRYIIIFFNIYRYTFQENLFIKYVYFYNIMMKINRFSNLKKLIKYILITKYLNYRLVEIF